MTTVYFKFYLNFFSFLSDVLVFSLKVLCILLSLFLSISMPFIYYLIVLLPVLQLIILLQNVATGFHENIWIKIIFYFELIFFEFVIFKIFIDFLNVLPKCYAITLSFKHFEHCQMICYIYWVSHIIFIPNWINMIQ